MNTSVQASTAFLEAAHSHVDQHEQHALEVVQRLRLYSENYVEPAPPSQDTRPAAARPDAEIDTSDIPETKEFLNPQRGVFSGSPNRSKSEIATEDPRQPFQHGGLAREPTRYEKGDLQ